MKYLLLAIITCTSLFYDVHAQGQDAVFSKIRIKGSIQFPDNKFPLEVYYYDGPERIPIDTITVRPDNTFEQEVALPQAGVYRLNCQKWEDLAFWGEDEDIEVHFRGQDTAKIKIKNPPYEHIVRAGKNNELMNWINFFSYQAYQQMIAISQESYQARQSGCEAWQKYASNALNKLFEDDAYMNYLATYYADRNSAVALLSYLKNKEVKKQLESYLEKEKGDYPPFVRYKKEQEEKAMKLAQLQPGKLAPEFSCPEPDGKNQLGPQDYRGKYLLIDFWASWCGPCRKAIPKVKEVYDKYHSKGLEILSVSIDAKKEAWLKAVSEEKMPWKQVLAPRSGKEILKQYQFNGIPHLVLLDKEGKIIERGVLPDKLDELLSKVME